MTTDLAIVGNPFLDLTLEGLPRVPALGEELAARAAHVAPGGTGMQAIAAARLGLSVALVARIGRDAGGSLVRDALDREGVRLIGGRAEATSTTVLLSTPGGVAMASVVSREEPTAEDLASSQAAAVITSLGRLPLAPPEARAYVVTGSLELPQAWDAFVRSNREIHALVVNRAEAARLTGHQDPERAIRHLAVHAGTAVVTLGAEGAVGASGEAVEWADAPEVDVADATGAGDVFVAAYAWADLRGADLRSRLAWSVLYASLSVREPTALAGAVRLDQILAEGERCGLTPP